MRLFRGETKPSKHSLKTFEQIRRTSLQARLREVAILGVSVHYSNLDFDFHARTYAPCVVRKPNLRTSDRIVNKKGWPDEKNQAN